MQQYSKEEGEKRQWHIQYNSLGKNTTFVRSTEGLLAARDLHTTHWDRVWEEWLDPNSPVY